MTVHQLPDVGRIEGLKRLASPLNDPVADAVELQYTDRTEQHERHALKMPLMDALYLLRLLEGMSREQDFDRLRRPPGATLPNAGKT